MTGTEMMVWAISQIGRCVTACVTWFNTLMERINGDEILLFVFFIGAAITLFLKPIVGYGIGAIGADTVNSVYRNRRYQEDRQRLQNQTAVKKGHFWRYK